MVPPEIQNTNSNTKKTILLVEDSPVQRMAMTELLENEGLNVITAPNGKIGVEMAKSAHPDLIILDFEMPELNGLETCKMIKQDSTILNIPIILMTSNTQEDLVGISFDLGAIDFIPKDAFSNAVILETLRQMNILPMSGALW